MIADSSTSYYPGSLKKGIKLCLLRLSFHLVPKLQVNLDISNKNKTTVRSTYILLSIAF